ncbi:unnamed protein product [Ectocarpus sp. 13 AM-2016]
MVESRLGNAGGTGGDGRAETAHLRKYDEHKAQLCLADEELRPALRAGFMEFTELKRRLPQVDEASVGCQCVQQNNCHRRRKYTR